MNRRDQLWAAAVKLAKDAQEAAGEGLKFYTSPDRAAIVAAQTIATATIFAALIEQDLAEQIRDARAQS